MALAGFCLGGPDSTFIKRLYEIGRQMIRRDRNHPSVTAFAAGDSIYCVQQTATAYNLCLLAVCPALRADSDTDYQPTGKSGV